MGKATALTSGTHTIRSGGKNRSFILRIPDGRMAETAQGAGSERRVGGPRSAPSEPVRTGRCPSSG
ncbi:hypothetical protein GCM10011428_17930 [Streptomyces violaceus]